VSRLFRLQQQQQQQLLIVARGHARSRTRAGVAAGSADMQQLLFRMLVGSQSAGGQSCGQQAVAPATAAAAAGSTLLIALFSVAANEL
jgi:hypothetical protein